MKIQNENRLIIIPNREQIPNIDEYSETVKSWPKYKWEETKYEIK
jgi:hypothetical protein